MLLVTYFRIRIVSAADIGGNENTAESVKTNRDSGSHCMAFPLAVNFHAVISI